MEYPIVKNKPVASFYYKGNHSHPVKRVVLITETDESTICGYEIKCGNEVFDVDNATIKSYRKDWIATADQLRANSALRKKLKSGESTFQRMSMKALEEVGV